MGGRACWAAALALAALVAGCRGQPAVPPAEPAAVEIDWPDAGVLALPDAAAPAETPPAAADGLR